LTLSRSFSRYISLLRYLILRPSFLSRPLRQRHASSAYCKHQREPSEKVAKRLATVSSPSRIASQGRNIQGNGRAKPSYWSGSSSRDGACWTNWSYIFCSYVAVRMLHHRLTRLAGCTQRAPHRHSPQATGLCLVPLSWSCCRVHCRQYRGPMPSSVQ
jgi:hypothetical protein